MIKPYIKNETAVDIICSICDRVYPGMGCEPADCEWMKMLEEEAVDAVPVVRCKDCKWFADNNGGQWYGCKMFQVVRITPEDAPKPDDFCSYGEKRDGGADNV